MTDPNSDLWISLEEAVSSTGVSKRTIQEWVRSGQVKREKRKGKVFLWVADLTKITPLTREREPKPDEVPTPEPEVLAPSYENYPGAPMKMLGEKLKENQEMQEMILAKVGDVEGALQRLGEIEKTPGLDERTVKELSLLGSVFRSIHQQNEKVGQALGDQGEMIKNLGEQLKTEQSWRDRWDQIRSRLTLWKGLTIAAIFIFLSAAVLGLQEHLRRQGLWDLERIEQQHKEEDLINDLDQERQLSSRTSMELKNTSLSLKAKETLVVQMEEEQKKLQERQLQQQAEIRTALQHLQSRELELERMRLAHEKELKKFDERHKAELKRMEESFDKTLQSIKDREMLLLKDSNR